MRPSRLVVLAGLLAACSGNGAPGSSQAATHPSAAATATALTSAQATTPAPAQRQETPLSAEREETAAAALDGTLFVIGGYDVAGHSSSSVLTYTAQAWSTGPSLPIALDHPAAAVTGGRLYVAGGFMASAVSAQVFRLAGDRWEAVAPLHHRRGALSLVELGGTLYALGGRDATTSIGIAEAYDPDRNVWTDLPAMPSPRHHMAGFAYRGMACVAGGKFPYTARVDCYDPGARRWQRLPDLPQPTSGAGAAVISGAVLVAGGEATAVVAQLYRFDGSAWRGEAMLIPRHGFQLAVLGERAWACGGGTLPGLHPSAFCTSLG